MHLAYSALRNTKSSPVNPRATARYHGYLAACQKHKDTIAAIKQYLPDWEPPFGQAVGHSGLRALKG